MKTAYKFRIYPNKKQQAVLDVTLETCRHLWNNALADRKNTWDQDHQNTSYEDQAAILTLEKQHNPYLKGVFSQAEQDVLRNSRKPLTTFSGDAGNMLRRKAIPGSKPKVATVRSPTPNQVSSSPEHD